MTTLLLNKVVIARLTASTFIVISTLLIILGYYLDNPWPLLIGIGLIIWGSALFFVTSTKTVRADLITSQLSSLTLALDRILKSDGYDGNTYILPPKLPGEQPVQVMKHRKDNNATISIVPPGLHLENLFEEVAGKGFLSLGISELEDLLVKAVVEKLELSSDFKLSVKEDKIIIKMNDFVFDSFYNYMNPIVSNQKSGLFYCPTVSALGCACAKATLKTVVIEDVELIRKQLNITFKLFSPEASA